MVFQDYALYPHKTVFENMAFGLRLRKRPEHEISARVGEAAGILQIEHLLERKPRELSGGQRQRVAMGRAIVRQPKAFLFDEPLSNLDALLRAEMRVEIKKLHQRLGNTIIYVTHDQVEAMTLADRIVVLQAGQPDPVRHAGRHLQPAGRAVRRRLHRLAADEFPAVRASAKAAARCTLPGGVDLPVPAARVRRMRAPRRAATLTFGLRPEHIAPARRRARRRCASTASVMLVEPLGSDTLGLIELGIGGDAGEMTGRFPPEAGLRVGQTARRCRSRWISFHCSIPTTGAAMRGADLVDGVSFTDGGDE